MDSKQAMALVGLLVVIAAGVYVAKGAKDMGIGWQPTGQSGAGFPGAGDQTCIRYDLKEGTWICTAIGTP